MRLKHILALGFLVILSVPGAAQDMEGFRFTVQPERLAVPAGAHSQLVLEAIADPGYYLYQDMFSLQMESPEGIVFAKPVYPSAHAKYDPNTETEKMVYDGTTRIPLTFEVKAGAPQEGTIKILVNFQGCSPTLCYLPQVMTLAVPYRLSAAAVPAIRPQVPAAAAEPAPAAPTTPVPPPAPAAGPSSAKPGTSASSATPGGAPPAAPEKEDRFRTLIQSNYFLAFLLVFVFGIGTSFTPCVYPIIPITISLFGARGAESKFKGFLLSLIYVQGICLVYSILGVASALSGAVFGQFMSNPWVVGVIVTIFLALGLFMAGIFQFNLPSSIQTKASKVGGKGFVGAFTMGMVAGIIAAPCTGPALAGVLTYVSTTQNAVLGFFLLYTYSLGFGLLFIVLGTFSTLIHKLPKSGEWMEIVKGVFAVLMFTAGWYFLRNILPALNFEFLSRQTLVIAGPLLLLLGWQTRGLRIDFHGAALRQILRKTITLLILTLGLIFMILALLRPEPIFGTAHLETTAPLAEVTWSHDLEDALSRARIEGKPVMVDFYADWCSACIELDKFTYTDPAVVEELKRFRAVKVDMTRPLPRDARLKATYGIVGLPVVAFYDSRGRLLESPRVTGFLGAKEFLPLLRQVK
jgi:thiol:disulfide interchange protein DsbD